jgi:hypothetical protein
LQYAFKILFIKYEKGVKMTPYIEKSLPIMVIFLLIPFLLTGCPYEPGIPLSSPGESEIDSELIGKWKYEDKEGHTLGTATISPFNDTELLIVLHDEERNERDMYRAFVTTIDKEKFLNIQEIKGTYEKRAWMFINYSTANCILSYKIVDDEVIKKNRKNLSSSKELYAFIKENLENNNLYGNGGKTDLKCIRNSKDVTIRTIGQEGDDSKN